MYKKFFCLLILSACLLCGCKKQPSYLDTPTSSTYLFFDTVVTISIYDNLPDNKDILNDCFEICEKYEHLFDKTNPESDIAKINASSGTATNVNSDTIEIIEDSIEYAKLTNGSFDITISPLTDLWDIRNNKGYIPSDKDINNILKNVSYKNIIIENNYVRLANKNSSIDLGGIAKGYIADKIREYMLSKNITSAIIDLGGNILTIGNKCNNSDFNIGIKTPFSETSQYIATISANNKSVVTSGIYERYFEKDGKIYHHILDSATGYPVENNLYSVTIICDKSEYADALSTGIFSLGLNKGKKLINSLDNVEAIFITNENKIILSDGLQIDKENHISLK